LIPIRILEKGGKKWGLLGRKGGDGQKKKKKKKFFLGKGGGEKKTHGRSLKGSD